MRTLDEVRGLFPVETILEVIEHTGNSTLNGQRRRVLHAQQNGLRVEVLNGPHAGSPHYWMALPKRTQDVLELSENHVRFHLDDENGAVLALRVLARPGELASTLATAGLA
jgi:hypothetical protein